MKIGLQKVSDNFSQIFLSKMFLRKNFKREMDLNSLFCAYKVLKTLQNNNLNVPYKTELIIFGYKFLILAEDNINS